jgi:flagellar biosynthesis protein FlhF
MSIRTYKGKEIYSIMNRIKLDYGEEAQILATRHEDNMFLVDVITSARRVVQGKSSQSKPNEQQLQKREESYVIATEAEERNKKAKSYAAILSEQGIHKDYLEEALKSFSYQYTYSENLERYIKQKLKFDAQLYEKNQFIALIGSTGVGKTTTIAKLASKIILANDDVKVGLIAADNYRIGAGMHLQSYAQILNIPFQEVGHLTAHSEPKRREQYREQLYQACEAFKDYDVVLIDTPGLSPHDEQKVENLVDDFSSFSWIEKVLVLPAPSNNRDLQTAVAAFGMKLASRVIVTKLDETGYTGPVFNTVCYFNKPLAFTTFGQRVPDDIEPATAKRLVSNLLKEMH